MARIPRKELIDEGEIGVYHCVQRCVRRAFLCGRDPLTGCDYEHRRGWIQTRLEFLAGQFGIDVLSFAVLSNHLHLVVRNRPDVVRGWSDEEVARRWWNLFPKRRQPDGSPAELQPHELRMLLADGQQLGEYRRRLSSISWLMRCLAEKVARQANREDRCTGRFWEGRYKCQRLLDESAVLACAVYVDLNPVRAGIAETPESSRYTSAYQRIHARRQRRARKSRLRPRQSRQSARRSTPPIVMRDDWLSPIELNASRERRQTPRSRASHRGFLPLKLTQYLELLDWTGRQVRSDGRASIPAELSPILERLQIVEAQWVDLVRHFGRWFHRAIGRPPNLAAEAASRERRWLHGVSHVRNAFA